MQSKFCKIDGTSPYQSFDMKRRAPNYAELAVELIDVWAWRLTTLDEVTELGRFVIN